MERSRVDRLASAIQEVRDSGFLVLGELQQSRTRLDQLEAAAKQSQSDLQQSGARSDQLEAASEQSQSREVEAEEAGERAEERVQAAVAAVAAAVQVKAPLYYTGFTFLNACELARPLSRLRSGVMSMH